MSAGADIRVLLVDDQELFREGVRVIVDAQEGMEVVGVAGDGEVVVEPVRVRQRQSDQASVAGEWFTSARRFA